MSAPKITHVQRTNCRTWRLLYADGDSLDLSPRQDIWAVRAALEARGQTLAIPDDVQPGWVGIPEDLPQSEPLPDLTLTCWGYKGRATSWSQEYETRPEWTPVATLRVRTDPATGEPVATIEWVTP